jgi:DNA polymerase-1
LSKKAKDRAKDRGYIVTWGGRRRRFLSREEAIKLGWSVKPWDRYMDTHKALNALIQGSAADMLKKSMIRVAEMVDWKNTYLHLTVHDELDFSIPKGAAGTKFRDDLRHAMEDWPMRVPIKVELERGATWGDTTKIKREDND